MGDEVATARTDDDLRPPPAPRREDADQALAAALESARDRLLDRSLRNRLINTPLGSATARQVRISGRRSDEVFRTLSAGRVMTFAAGAEASAEPPLDIGERPSREGRLPTSMTAEALQKRLLSLYYEGQTLEEEQGVNVLFLALGFLEWRETRAADTPRYAPLILLPVDLVRDGAKDRFKLELRPDDLIANVSLQAWLKDNFGLALPDLPDDEDWTPSDYAAQVAAAIGERPGWSVRPDEILLGFFSFAKFLLWRDLDPANWPRPAQLTGHPILRQVLLRDDQEVEDTPLIGDDGRIDEVFPLAELIHITDADSSQAIAIQEVMAGKNLVIQGPPGTGKSQTITNIIAGAVHRGRSVLFVAEKMAALEVVHQRLVDRGLAPLCLELHSRKAAKTQVLDQLRRARDATAPAGGGSGILDLLSASQGQLRAQSDRLHRRGGAGLSAFDLIGAMSLLQAQGAPAPRFELAEAANWGADMLEAARARAERLGGRLALAGAPAAHPWRGAGMAAPDALEQARLAPLLGEVSQRLTTLSAAGRAAGDLLGVGEAPSLAETPDWISALRHLAQRREAAIDAIAHPLAVGLADDLAETASAAVRLRTLRAQLEPLIRPEAWREDWATCRRILAGEGGSLLRIFSGRYRAAVADLRGVWIGKLPKQAARIAALDDLMAAQALVKALEEAEARLKPWLADRWRGEATDWVFAADLAAWLQAAAQHQPRISLVSREVLERAPKAAIQASALEDAQVAALGAFDELAARLSLDEVVAFDGRPRGALSAADLAGVVQRWRGRLGDIAQWPPIRDDLAWLNQSGAGDFARQVFEGEIAPEQTAPVLMLAAYEAMWKAMLAADPTLGQAQGDDLDPAVRRFRGADRARIRSLAREVAQVHMSRRPTGSAGAVGVLVDEMNKSRRLKPVRQLMEQAGEAILRFTPVFLMSPLSIAQYLKPGVVQFDLLVIDEASQVRPEDALGAIARCRQVVVVGDDRQLPPTSFFNRMVNDDGPDDEDDEDVSGPVGVRKATVKDIESILNLCSRFPERMLRWHYRSEHPALIATSNRNFYRNQLMMPPSVVARASDGDTGLVFHAVTPGGYERGRTARNEIEAEAVAQAVLRHARERTDLSLGVGTFSVAQRDCVRDRIDDLARKHPELDAFIKGTATRAPLFVKNLENIQGDERDVIFISVGYGKDRDGRLTQNFGPVGREGGERRLNVLITRARKRCEVFSSLDPDDIKLDAGARPGVVALKEFLTLARHGYSDLITPSARGFDSDFEHAVSLAVRDLGYDCHPQVGMAGFFIDLGVVDPADPDRYILGIECDGAAYHASRYARDRDRLRQQILEARGWRMHRIWSTDWFYRRDHEIEKLRQALDAAAAGRPAPIAPVEEVDFLAVERDEPALEATAEFNTLSASTPATSLPPYRFATPEAPQGIEPHRLSAEQLAGIVSEIVRIEQPIHEEEVARRLAAACGLQRAGSRVQEAALAGLRAAEARGEVRSDGPFWLRQDSGEILPRTRSGLASGDHVRKAGMIAPGELAAAAELVLRQNQALEAPELISETSRALGFSRLTPDLSAAISAAIETQLRADLETDHLNRLRLAPPALGR
jgi:very-short-patch-repair endonuclease